MLSLPYYVQHFLPFSFAEAASERRFFFCGCAGVRRRSSDASVRKASSTFVEVFADVSRKGHASSSDFARASSAVTALPGASLLLPIMSLQQSSDACLFTSANHSETWSKDSRCVIAPAPRPGPRPAPAPRPKVRKGWLRGRKKRKGSK